VATGSLAAVRGGFTAISAMANTSQLLILRELLSRSID